MFTKYFLLMMLLALPASAIAGPARDFAKGTGIHHTRIYDGHGKLVASLEAPNLWVTVGKNATLNDALDNGQPVSSESEGNTGGSATAVTLTLLQDQNGQTATIIPGSLTSLTLASYTGTFSDNGAGVITCSGTCTHFTSGTITYSTGALALSFSSAGPNSNAGTASYSYIVAKWYHHLIIEQSHLSNCTTTTGGSSTTLTCGTSVTTQTGQNITCFGCGASGANLVTTIVTGASSTSQTMAAGASTAISGTAVVSFGPTFAAGDTMASHANWTEMTSSNVTNSTAPQWVPNAASTAASITNSTTTANYTIASAPSPSQIYVWGWATGASNVLPGATGPLFSEAIFSAGAQAVQANYILDDTYTATQS
jgi:hypothetical protein